MNQHFTFLAGLPRAGSTVLSALLSQNPRIHAEGFSSLCQIMWDVRQSCYGPTFQALQASRRTHTAREIVAEIPTIYYKNCDRPIVVDKCRTWMLPDNMAMIREFITPDPKVIVLSRPVDEVLASFARIREANNLEGFAPELLLPNTDPLMRPLAGVEYARYSGDPAFIVIEYAELCNDPEGTLGKIYAHCGWDAFEHDFENIVNPFPEDDEVYGLRGLHTIRRRLERLDYATVESNATSPIPVT